MRSASDRVVVYLNGPCGNISPVDILERDKSLRGDAGLAEFGRRLGEAVEAVLAHAAAHGHFSAEAALGATRRTIAGPLRCPTREEYEAAKAKLPLAQFFSAQTSSAQRLPNGNTLICEGDTGRVFEVTQDHETVWEHLSPRHGQLYRAYRMPYDSLPRRRRPVERPVAPPPDPRRGEAEPIPGQPTP